MHKVKRIKLDGSPVLESVVHEDLLNDLPLKDFYVDSVKEIRDISKTIVSLTANLKIEPHLKRARGKDVLLCAVEAVTLDELSSKDFLKDRLLNDVKIVKVPARPPKTRKQFEQANELWPCNFHPSKYLEALVSNQLFSPLELDVHVQYLNLAISVANQSFKLNATNKPMGVVIVDPSLQSVVSVGFDRSHEGPCRHACMIAIDNVAKTQTGGVYSPFSTHSNPNFTGIPTELQDFLENTAFKFGSKPYKKKDKDADPEGPYLCTGYYLYSTHEPCIMCAMALTHSRIKRVFYGTESSKGGLGSLAKCHVIEDLNHHYEVFRSTGLLRETCQKL